MKMGLHRNVGFLGVGGSAPDRIDDLWAYWSMDETSNDVARADATGNGHHLDLIGGTGVIGATTAKVGAKAMGVQTTTIPVRYIKTTDTLAGNGIRTIGGWIKGSFTYATYSTTFIYFGASPFAKMDTGGPPDSSALWIAGLLSADEWNGSSWTHVAYTEADGAVFINGAYVGDGGGGIAGVIQFTSTVANETPIFDEWGIWNQTLTQDDINYLYNSGFGRAYPFV